MPNSESVTILLVEDDLAHASLIKKNLRRVGIKNKIIHLEDGQSAVDLLLGKGKYEGVNRPVPLMILLDINLPVLDGHDVLKIIKSNESTQKIPIIVITTSATSMEIEACYELGCNIFIQKPVDYQKFSQAIQKLGLFFEVMKLPEA